MPGDALERGRLACRLGADDDDGRQANPGQRIEALGHLDYAPIARVGQGADDVGLAVWLLVLGGLLLVTQRDGTVLGSPRIYRRRQVVLVRREKLDGLVARLTREVDEGCNALLDLLIAEGRAEADGGAEAPNQAWLVGGRPGTLYLLRLASDGLSLDGGHAADAVRCYCGTVACLASQVAVAIYKGERDKGDSFTGGFSDCAE